MDFLNVAAAMVRALEVAAVVSVVQKEAAGRTPAATRAMAMTRGM